MSGNMAARPAAAGAAAGNVNAGSTTVTVTRDFDWNEVSVYQNHVAADRSLMSVVHDNYKLEVDTMNSVTLAEWDRFVRSQRDNELMYELANSLAINGRCGTKHAVANKKGHRHSVGYAAYVAEDDNARDRYHVLLVKAVQTQEMDWGRVIAGIGASGAGGAGLGAGIGFCVGGVPGALAGAKIGGMIGGGACGLKCINDSTQPMQNVVLGYMAHSLLNSGHIKKVGQKYQLQLDN